MGTVPGPLLYPRTCQSHAGTSPGVFAAFALLATPVTPAAVAAEATAIVVVSPIDVATLPGIARQDKDGGDDSQDRRDQDSIGAGEDERDDLRGRDTVGCRHLRCGGFVVNCALRGRASAGLGVLPPRCSDSTMAHCIFTYMKRYRPPGDTDPPW